VYTPMVVMGHFCWPWPGAVGGTRTMWGSVISTAWVGTRGEVRSNLSRSLWAYSRRWRESSGSGPGERGGWDGAATTSFHGHHYAASHILLDSVDP